MILPPAGAQEVALTPDRSGISVNGVQLTASSPIRSLRAACAYLGISTSGGKAKLYDRILSFLDEQHLAFAQEIKANLGPSVPTREQRLIEPPTPAERREHELTLFFCWRLLGLIPGGTPFSQLNKGVKDAMVESTGLVERQFMTKTCKKAIIRKQNSTQRREK